MNLRLLPITRQGRPPGFSYRDPRGREITNPDEIGRIRAIVIPPAWRDVHIASSAGAKVQAVGVDARGRKQYKYSAAFRARRDGAKFSRMPEFAAALPKIRRRCRADVRKRGLPKEKVLAAIVLVLDDTLIRIGSEEYARENGSYGLSTMEDRHARTPGGGKVVFEFKAKSGIRQRIDLRNPELVRVVKACKDLPGSQLFQYRGEDGTVHDVKAADVNDYLRKVSGIEVTAKDFRTWAATALACAVLRQCERGKTMTAAKRRVAQVVRDVAQHLGNTPAVCRKSYIAPQVLDAFVAGALHKWQVPVGRNGRLSRAEERKLRQLLVK